MMITPLHTVFYLMKIPTVVLSKIKVKIFFCLCQGEPGSLPGQDMLMKLCVGGVSPPQAQEHRQGGAQAEEVLNPAHRWR